MLPFVGHEKERHMKSFQGVVVSRARGLVKWIFTDKTYDCALESGACPFCLKVAVVQLPPPLLAVQPDDTTHVCHPALDGCNHGFSKGA